MDKTLIGIINAVLKEKGISLEAVSLTFSLLEPNRLRVFKYTAPIGTINITEPTDKHSWVVEFIPL